MTELPERRTIYIGERAVDTALIIEASDSLLDCNLQVVDALQQNLSIINPGLDTRPESFAVRQALDKISLGEKLRKRWKKDEVALVRLLVESGIHTHPAKIWDKILHIFPYARELPRKDDAENFLNSRKASIQVIQSPAMKYRLGSLKTAGFTMVQNTILRGAMQTQTYMLPTHPGRFSPN